MRRFLITFSFLALALAAVFTHLPAKWGKPKLLAACEDYCQGYSKSPRTGFSFLNKNWELCECQVAQEARVWETTICFTQCVNRCRSTKGRCANNKKNNAVYLGQCCTTEKTNATLQAYCFGNITNMCACNGHNSYCPGAVTPIGGFGR